MPDTPARTGSPRRGAVLSEPPERDAKPIPDEAKSPSGDDKPPRAGASSPTPPPTKGSAPDDLSHIGAAGARTVQSTSLALLALLGLIAALWIGQVIAAPVLVALILGVVLSPVSDFWDRRSLRPSLSAFLTVSCVMLGIVAIVLVFEPYIRMAIERAPLIWRELRGSIDAAREMLTGAEEIAQDVADAVAPETSAAAGVALVPVAEDDVGLPSVTDALFLAPQVLSSFLIFAGTLYFFLLTRAQTYGWAAAAIGTLEVNDFRRAERRVSKYLLTITAINAVFGILVAIAMKAIGMPVPLFWGLAAFMLNYILYLGPIFLGMALLVGGDVAFDGAMSFVPAALYLGMNATEGQFLTPALVGQRMAVNPLAVFLSLVFWMWLWGPIGAIVAIPVLIWGLSIRGSGLYRQEQIEADTAVEPQETSGSGA